MRTRTDESAENGYAWVPLSVWSCDVEESVHVEGRDEEEPVVKARKWQLEEV